MNLKNILTLFSVIILLPLGLSAETRYLSLAETLQMALKHNQTLAVSRYEERVGSEQVKQATARALPQVNANGNVTDNYKRQVLVLPPGVFGGAATDKPTTIQAGTLFSTGLGVEASQALVDPSVFIGLSAAKASEKFYQLNTVKTEEDVISQTAQAYYRILASRMQIATVDSNISRLNVIIKASEAQVKAGLARRIDLDRIRVSLTNAQTLRLQYLNSISAQMNFWKTLIGVSLETDISPAQLAFSEIEEKVKAYGPVQGFDVEQRTEIKLIDQQISLLNYQEKAIRAENYPKLSAFGNYYGNAVSNEFKDFFKEGGQDVAYGMGSVGIRLTVPVFDGFSRQSRTRVAKIQQLEAKQRREQTVLALTAGYESANYQMANSIQAIQSQHENVQLAENVYSASQTNYRLGLASLTDLLDAQNAYILAQVQYTQSLLDYKVAEIESIRSAGRLNTLLQ
jgi:outer membrane protein TolC